MISSPRALSEGSLLGGRFEVERLLGKGGFGIVYAARDIVRNDIAVVKELAPGGSRREGSLLHLDEELGSAHRLRQSFLQEARHLSRLSCPGILPIRAVFAENGTAYYATDYLADSITLEKLLIREGRLDAEGAMDILFQLLETLEIVHGKGIVHRDVKPNNILIAPDGRAYLIDFGSAREWHADSATTHTILYTPGYAPIEQLSERGKRGPATDIYALCATAYRMLTGTTPLPAPDRIEGREMPPLSTLRPDVEPSVARAIESGLAVKYHDRPQTVGDFRTLLSQAEEDIHPPLSLASFDAKLVRLKTFNFERRQCPACRGILENPRPLRKWGCPVCREGTIRLREIEARLCPNCQLGTLHRRSNVHPLAFCPACRTGHLAHRRKGLLNRELLLDCLNCKASFRAAGENIEVISAKGYEPDESRTETEWRDLSGRSETVWNCDGCDAQYDVLEDRRWEQTFPPAKRYKALYPEDWSRVAAGLPPGTGNAACDICRADFFVDKERLTLLSTEIDDFGFAEEHLGRLLYLEDIRWLGVNKESPNPGFVCAECATEFDLEADYLRLVRTSSHALLRHIGEPRKLVDWHRIALGLPETHEEEEFHTDVLSAIVNAYEFGEIGFETNTDVIWRGPAVREGVKGQLLITPADFTFGGLLKKKKLPIDAIVSAIARKDQLDLRLSGEVAPTTYEIAPVEMTVQFSQSNHTVKLGAENLARRLQVLIK